jgi:hypothetical protein
MSCSLMPCSWQQSFASGAAAAVRTSNVVLLHCCCCCCCSAPEILLAVVESVLRLGKSAGELGPSTIVGSAAYNLLMIVAVCTVSLPTGENSGRSTVLGELQGLAMCALSVPSYSFVLVSPA